MGGISPNRNFGRGISGTNTNPVSGILLAYFQDVFLVATEALAQICVNEFPFAVGRFLICFHIVLVTCPKTFQELSETAPA